MTKKLMSVFLSMAMILNMVILIPFDVFATGTVSTFEYDGYTVNYEITNSWNDGQNNDVKVTITNTGAEVIENWMLAYDFKGTAANFSRAQAFEAANGVTYVKNIGTNLSGNGDSISINPGMSVDFRYHLTDPTGTPDSFALCQERTALEQESDYTVTLNPQWDFGNSFQGQILISNLTDKSIECWELTFVCNNFTMQNSWERTLIDHGNGRYTIKPITGNIVHIAPNSTLSLGFQANKDANLGFDDLDITFEGLTEVVFNTSENNNGDDNATLNPVVLSGFSEYGANILSWSIESVSECYTIYRSADGVNFDEIASLDNVYYYIDSDVNNNVEYTYYIGQIYGDSFVNSNSISIITSQMPSDVPDEIPNWIASLMNLEDDYSKLSINYQDGDNREYVTKNLGLKDLGEKGSIISWLSSNEIIITKQGLVSRPNDENFIIVTLTAIIENNGYAMKKIFEVHVSPQQQIVVNNLTLEDIAELNGGEIPNITYSNNNTIEFIDGIFAGFPVYNAEDALSAIKGVSTLLGIQDVETELIFESFSTNSIDNIFCFSQYHQDIKVFGTAVTVIANKNTGIADYLYSSYQSNYDISLNPIVSSSEAKQIVSSQYDVNITDEPELVIYDVDPDSIEPKLAWIIITDSTSPSKVYLNAYSGEVIYTEMPREAQTTTTQSNTLLGRDVTVNIEKSGILWWTEYKLYDSIRNIKVLNGTADANTEYVRDNNDWSDSTYDTALAAAEHTGVAYDFFNNLGWQGYDNHNSKMDVIAHYQEQNKTTGVWEHVSNAWSSGSTLGFGDGNGTTTQSYIADIDTVGHEFTHSVTGAKIGIMYLMESGAINEAYSDIFGEFMDYKKDWLHGTDIRIGTIAGQPGRDLINPSNSGLPSAYLDTRYGSTADTSKDHGNVHTNGTVISHAAYLMSQKGISLDELTQIWYNSYNYYNGNKLPDFIDCRFAVTQAAERLYGRNSMNASLVQEAFDEVNVKEYEVLITVKDALTGEVIPNQGISIVSVDKKYCRLWGSCCNTHSCRGVSCDPDECKHNCDYACYYGGCTANLCCGATVTMSRKTNNNGQFVCESMAKGYHRIKISGDGYEPLNQLIYVDRDNINLDVELETLYTSKITGKIVEADDDTDMTNNPPLLNAHITLTKISGSLELEQKQMTNSAGEYTFENLPAGTYEITVHKYGYVDIVQTLNVKRGERVFYNIAIEAISDAHRGLGYASGTIFDAVSGAGVSNLTLEVYSGILIGVEKPSSAPLDIIQSGSIGSYTTSALDAGNYTVFIIDNRTGVLESERYLTSSFSIKVLGNTNISSQNGTVSKTLNGNQLRIVLTWGSSPRDLDSYLYINTKSGSSGRVFYGSKKYYLDGTKIADLDLDDTSSYGPETTTIYADVDGSYYFYVHDYTNRGYGSSNYYLSNSGATVTVYSGNSNLPIAVYSVPTGLGTAWKVFSYDSSTGEITTYNQILSTLP